MSSLSKSTQNQNKRAVLDSEAKKQELEAEEIPICTNIEELESLLLLNVNLVLYPKKTDSSYEANMALASDRLKEAFDLILAHFT